MKGEKGIKFHYCEVITEKNECRDINDVSRIVPKMRHEFERTCRR